MEQALLNRVYINPNFKRTETWPTEPVKTTHFNRYFHEVVPNRVTNTESYSSISNSRKIYVNPNFIGANNIGQSVTQAKSQQQIDDSKSLKNPLLFKSKYSLVHNVLPKRSQNDLNKQSKNDKCSYVNENMIVERNPEPCQSTRRSITVQEVPLTRSRYCIVRKKKLTSNLETMNRNISMDLINNSYSDTGANNLTCLEYCENNKISNRTLDKVLKIKISKYKTIPVNYLRRNSNGVNNKNTLAASSTCAKRNIRYSSTLITLNKNPLITRNKNRFKFTKTNTPQKGNSLKKTNISCNVSKVKMSSRITQQSGKKVHNASKVKILTAKFKINNIPCRLYTKYGKCLRQDQGNCKYLHDKKHVSLCRKFLKGICHDENCSLSHELTAKKMPTCYFYLKGMCTKESCPYLHVKLGDKTKVCQEFSKGYCESGDACPFRHVKMDPLKTSGKISKNTFRKHSQIKRKGVKQIEVPNDLKISNSTENLEKSERMMDNECNNCRYYKEMVDSEATCAVIKPTRCKLGTLPSFIQL